MELRAPDLSGYSYCIIIYCLSPVSFKDAGLFLPKHLERGVCVWVAPYALMMASHN